MIKLYNTYSKKIEEFKPLKGNKVGMYTCGPTVYDYDHIGHAWNYTTADLLRRMLEYSGFKVKQVINITDVGHLTSDADTGEDKLEKSSRELGKTAQEIAVYFTKIYFENRKKLNLEKPWKIAKATGHIKEMIKLVQVLIDKGFAYQISDGIYFDTSKFPDYGKLSGNTLESLMEGARVEINPEKKNPTDFAVWKFSAENSKRQMEWDAFGKKGFPGWHIECSAMSMKYLGPTFDIHTGGEDNIFPHHESEIAQSECATGQPLANYWFHTRFLMVDGMKMSKSLKNFYTLKDLEEKGYSAMDLRYLFLQAHYATPINFTWESLEAAKIARRKLNDFVAGIKSKGKVNNNYKDKFLEKINDDLDLPGALALVWIMIKDNRVSDFDKKTTLLDFDRVLGLNLAKQKKEKIPANVLKLVQDREVARKEKNWQKSDELRNEIDKLDYIVEDTNQGSIVRKK
ncbi:cysteine--tRNA ligase [Candidatus Falkowbacteria bacterium]|nr:cysteine--tRNA ligase [Candidatus Falkowbacteria bacterium]